mmetsp:Transcript_94642/g.289517  ORF Transcript_94642/g.289517 Transcript_94642/m.289517 type:complete len:218 (+) Transcript_94642:4099-4752(+)
MVHLGLVAEPKLQSDAYLLLRHNPLRPMMPEVGHEIQAGHGALQGKVQRHRHAYEVFAFWRRNICFNAQEVVAVLPGHLEPDGEGLRRLGVIFECGHAKPYVGGGVEVEQLQRLVLHVELARFPAPLLAGIAVCVLDLQRQPPVVARHAQHPRLIARTGARGQPPRGGAHGGQPASSRARPAAVALREIDVGVQPREVHAVEHRIEECQREDHIRPR